MLRIFEKFSIDNSIDSSPENRAKGKIQKNFGKKCLHLRQILLTKAKFFWNCYFKKFLVRVLIRFNAAELWFEIRGEQIISFE